MLGLSKGHPPPLPGSQSHRQQEAQSPIPAALPGSGYQEEATRVRGLSGWVGLVKMYVQPEPCSGLPPLDFHSPKLRQEGGALKSLSTPRKLGKWFNWLSEATLISLDPNPVPQGCRPEGLGSVGQDLWVPGRGSRRDGRGSPSAFERQARTIGQNGLCSWPRKD